MIRDSNTLFATTIDVYGILNKIFELRPIVSACFVRITYALLARGRSIGLEIENKY